MPVTYEQLNEQQKEASEDLDGPVLVVGGPGSGKTTVIRHRYENLVENGVDPDNILLTTFSRDAAAELRDRIETHGSNIGTIHSVFYNIVREYYSNLGYETGNLNLYQREDVEALLRDILEEATNGNARESLLNDTVTFCRINLDRIRTQGLNPRDLEEAMEHNRIEFQHLIGGDQLNTIPDVEELMPGIYREFLKRMYERNAIDYTGMQYKAYIVLNNTEDALEDYRDRFKHILVDEAQDLSYVQWKLIDLLGREHKNVCLIGDDCQNIYSWRGSDHRFLYDFRDTYDATVYTLPRNYRSTQQIMDAVNKVMPYLKNVEHKELVADRGYEDVSAGIPQIIEAENTHLERNKIVREIRTLIEDEYDPEQIAILLRTKGRNGAKIAAYQEALNAMRLESSERRGFQFMDKKEIKWIMNHLKAYLNPDDDIVVWNLLLKQDGIGGGTLSNIIEAKPDDVPLAAFIENLSPTNDISELSEERLDTLKDTIQFLRDLETADNLVEKIYAESGLQKKITEWDGDPEAREMNITTFKGAMEDYPTTKQGVSDFFDYITNTAAEEEKSGVTITTMHGAKGKEWDAVFVPEMREGMVPHNMADVEEEKRLFYVALSRARERAYFSYYGTKSRFLDYLEETN